MKKSIQYIVCLFSLTLALTACEGREPDLFDKDANGAYFDYEYSNEFEKTLNFCDYIVGNPDTVSVTLKVKLLGYLMDEARTLSVKTKDVEGYEPADVTIEEVIFANKEYRKEFYGEGQYFWFLKAHGIIGALAHCPDVVLAEENFVFPLPDAEVEYGWTGENEE